MAPASPHLLLALGFICALITSAYPGTWMVTQSDDELRIAYGGGTDFPQYAVLRRKDSYFRMNYGPTSNWGTSVILFPSFWSGGQLFQGGRVTTATWTVSQPTGDLLLAVAGTTAGLTTALQVRLFPPAQSELWASVATTTVTGEVALDNRPGEAFQFAKLSSMRISPTQWDAQYAYSENRLIAIPQSGWLIAPPATGRLLGLAGGLSDWQRQHGNRPAPTIEIILPRSSPIAGWLKEPPSSDPNEDNIGFWAASPTVLRSWEYRIRAAPYPSRTAVPTSRWKLW